MFFVGMKGTGSSRVGDDKISGQFNGNGLKRWGLFMNITTKIAEHKKC